MSLFRYYCKECKIDFSSKEDIKLHWVFNCVWINSFRVKCAYCKYNFLSTKYLIEHWEKFYCRKFCHCWSCEQFYKALPVKDGVINDIYYCMLTKQTAVFSEEDLASKLKHINEFGDTMVKRARYIAGFKLFTCFPDVEC